MTVYIVNDLSYLAAKMSGEICHSLAQQGIELINKDCSTLDDQPAALDQDNATVIYVHNTGNEESWMPLRNMLERLSSSKVIVVASHYDEQELRLSLAKGAFGYLAKSSDLCENIKSAIDVVQTGGFYLGHKADAVVKTSPSMTKPVNDGKVVIRNQMTINLNDSGVTPRQKDVAEKLLIGMSNKEIANELSIEVGTVKVHVRALFKKFNITSRYQFYRLMDASPTQPTLQFC